MIPVPRLDQLVQRAEEIDVESKSEALGLLDEMLTYCRYRTYRKEHFEKRCKRMVGFGMLPSGSGSYLLVNVTFLGYCLRKTESWVRDFFRTCKYNPIQPTSEICEIFEDIYGNSVRFLIYGSGWECYHRRWLK